MSEENKESKFSSLRKKFGGMLEEKLNELVDKRVEALLVSEDFKNDVNGAVRKLGHLLKKDVIDLIDGEDDIK